MIGLSKVKMDILEFLWRMDKAVSLRDVSEGMGIKIRSVNMHFLNLKKNGYISKINGGFYALTDLGKEVLGFPRINREASTKILGVVPQEKAFHFYSDVDKPLMVSSNTLSDFCEKIREIDLRSVEFHSARGDFELWVHFLGDVELAKKLRLIRESNLSGEDLRGKIYETVRSRCEYLWRIALQTPV